jgi:hypothetical protein
MRTHIGRYILSAVDGDPLVVIASYLFATPEHQARHQPGCVKGHGTPAGLIQSLGHSFGLFMALRFDRLDTGVQCSM